jgi:hypothetical protein
MAARCKGCYYWRPITSHSYRVCHHSLFTGEVRNESADECTHYLTMGERPQQKEEIMPNKISEEVENKIIELYQKGETRLRIQRICAVSQGTIINVLKRRGISFNKKEPATAAPATSSTTAEAVSNTTIITEPVENVKPEPQPKPEPPYIYSEAARDAVYSEIQRKLSHLEFVKSAIEFLEHRIAEMQADEYYTSADIERLNADLEEMGGFENA